MNGLNILLFCSFESNTANMGPRKGFGDSAGVIEIILIA